MDCEDQINCVGKTKNCAGRKKIFFEFNACRNKEKFTAIM